MLSELRIRDLALLESVDLELSPGLNVVSGETGEGKSLLFLAISLLLGARARQGLVRKGAGKAVIEGRFALDEDRRSRLRRHTDLLEDEAEEICLRRVVNEEGKSRAYVDGALCPVGVLARLGRELVDVHGQRDAQSLCRSGEQRVALDRYAGLDSRARAYAEDWRALDEAMTTLQDWDATDSARSERAGYLRFQIRELEEAAVATGEEDELESRLRLLSRAGELGGLLERSATVLSEGESATASAASRLARELSDLVGDDPALQPLAQRLESLGLEAEDLGRECAQHAGRIDHDPEALRRTEDRLAAIRSLARRHRTTGDGLVERLAELRAELAGLGTEPRDRGRLEERVGVLATTLEETARKLQAARRRGAARLEKEIVRALGELRMERARFRIDAGPKEVDGGRDLHAAGAHGPHPVRFLVATNPGEPEQPLERIASGGETARIMLALKGALAGNHRVPLLIFDEIDSGIGGRVGMPFGRRIAAIAEHHQVLLITHLAQVAAFADRHFRVRKRVVGRRTRTEVATLGEQDKIAELAEMLGGEAAPEAAATQARALLEEAAS